MLHVRKSWKAVKVVPFRWLIIFMHRPYCLCWSQKSQIKHKCPSILKPDVFIKLPFANFPTAFQSPQKKGNVHETDGPLWSIMFTMKIECVWQAYFNASINLFKSETINPFCDCVWRFGIVLGLNKAQLASLLCSQYSVHWCRNRSNQIRPTQLSTEYAIATYVQEFPLTRR